MKIALQNKPQKTKNPIGKRLQLLTFAQSLRLEMYYIILKFIFLQLSEKDGRPGIESRNSNLKGQCFTIQLTMPTTNQHYLNQKMRYRQTHLVYHEGSSTEKATGNGKNQQKKPQETKKPMAERLQLLIFTQSMKLEMN